MLRNYFFYFLLVFISFPTIAQETELLLFDKTEHDFGLVREEEGEVRHTFTFVNKHDAPISLLNVVAGCGCTASDFTKTPVKPNDTGFVEIAYTTARRPGKFSQAVTVIIDLEGYPRQNIIVKGEVLPRVPTILDNYPIGLGNLHFKTTHLAFGKIKNTHKVTQAIPFYNNWDRRMRLRLDNPPSFISYKFKPRRLGAKEEGKLYITYDASKKGDYGLVFTQLTIRTNDESAPDKKFFISADIQEDFSHLNLEELKNAPVMDVEEAVFNFDSVRENTAVKHKFHFTNTGQSVLKVRKISTSCGCTASALSSYEIAPGEDGFIEVTFNSHRKRGYQRHTITVITNNPHNPVKQLVMEGYVKAPR